MPTIELNGRDHDLAEDVTIERLLETLGIQHIGTAVAVNSAIIPRGEHATRALRDRDRVEVVRAIGGG